MSIHRAGREAAAALQARGLELWSVGRSGETIRVLDVTREETAGQRVTVEVKGRRHAVDLPLVGDFQVSNALVAAGLVLARAARRYLVMHALESLKGAKGRLELVGRAQSGAPVFVDYAHKPDALENALSSLRPYTKNRLHVVFGCGGDRDRAKRPIMGEIATRLADRVYVTDDNPRTEEPAAIRAAIMAAAPGAVEIGGRAEAIRAAVEALEGATCWWWPARAMRKARRSGSRCCPSAIMRR
jgi:UDP-N-acetylmuramoyl-L-alanyl-D-glutamate--2,6-diaminopimelate ligase